MKYSQQVKDDARAAADYMRKKGWWSKGPQGPKGQVCPIVALSISVHNDDREMKVWNAIRKEADIVDIITWNEQKGRTQKEVFEVFKRIYNS